MAEEIYSIDAEKPYMGLHTDSDPLNQPKGTYRFALNGVNEVVDGKQASITNEGGNFPITQIPEGFFIIGDRYIGDDTSAVLLTNPVTKRDLIGLLNKDGKYVTVVNTVLGLNIHNQCDVTHRIRRGKETVLYWVDGLNKARTFNFSREYNFYTEAYQDYLKSGGDPNTYPGEKWDVSSFSLIKTYKTVPFFSNIEQLETGSILPGSYNFAIQYVDEDLNPTEWITVSNIVRIYNDATNSPYHKIRGSRNIDSSSQSFPRASKSIRLTITNLDTSFPYYRVAIIRAAGNNGTPDKALASELNPTSDSIFLYTGNDGSLTEVVLGEILVDQEIIFAPDHIEQLENRLSLANTEGKSMNWCDFQTFASRIKVDLHTEEFSLNNVESEPNVKNTKSTFIYRQFMPGDVASLAIAFLFDDGYISPAFHIPGKNPADNTSQMLSYELPTRYLDSHNCSTNNYWDKDYMGQTLVGKPQRHHRFPFRNSIAPLVEKDTTTVVVTKYRLRLTVTLNPAWTPGPISYPVDGQGNPIVIDYTMQYRTATDPSLINLNSQLVDTDMGSIITLYDDVTALGEITPGVFGQIDPASELMTYQVPGNNRFIITISYDSYNASSSLDNYQGFMFGIKLSNIVKPHPNVVGFYILKNERTDDDKLIVDNAIFGRMTSFQQYKSFGLLWPEQFYPVENCGSNDNVAGKTLLYHDKAMWFFNPEYQYLNKKYEFDGIHIDGFYERESKNMPTISNQEGYPCNVGNVKGVYIDDVQAGTSYNPDVHKKKNRDDDGFDLNIGYRNTNIRYNSITFLGPDIFLKERILYLNAASYQNYDGSTYYNVSVDNKIGMYVMQNDIDPAIWKTSDNKERIFYGSLVRNNVSAYSGFLNRPYYKIHNNPILFGSNNQVNNVTMFGGDVETSSFNMVSSVFYDMVVADRPKKSRLWKIIVGAVLIAAAIVTIVVTAGAGTPAAVAIGATALSSLAISYGVSLAVSGIKFEQFKSMIDTDYEKGLKDTVVDGGVWETVRDTIGRQDDTIRWFADRITNIYIESAVPFGLRCGLTCGVPDFLDSPAPYDENEFRTYLTEKLTSIDRDQGSGRLYKGYATAEVYDINLDYMRMNKEKVFTHLQLEYDCCADKNELFPTRVWYSEQSFQEERTDNYRVFLPNNYRDIEGEHGQITDLYRLGNNLYIHTQEGLWQLPQNVQERVTGEIVSLIGTGEFFSHPPKKVLDDSMGSGGTQHKWATIKTRNGVLFVSEIEGRVYLHGDGVKEISAEGNRNWFEENLKSFLPAQLYAKFGVVFPYANNPASPDGVGYLSNFDTRYNRVLITKRDYLILPDKLAVLQLVSIKPVAGNDFVYSFSDGCFYQGTTKIPLTNSDYFENKSWTISYSFHTNSWVSFHSYIPNYYIKSQNSFYSFINGSNSIWKHNMVGKYQTFYLMYSPFIVETVLVDSPAVDKITEDLTIQTEARMWDAIKKQFGNILYITFNKILCWNEAQSTGYFILRVKETQGEPGEWYQHQIAEVPGEIMVSRQENNWCINSIRDYVVGYDKPLFTKDWAVLKTEYFIDKVPNPDATSLAKDWFELVPFRGKYIVVRLKFDNFDNVSLTFNYLLETKQPSGR